MYIDHSCSRFSTVHIAQIYSSVLTHEVLVISLQLRCTAEFASNNS